MEIILAIVFVVVIILLVIRERQKRLQRMHQSFDGIEFPASGGLRGRDMRVVKRVIEAADNGMCSSDILGAYWYCVGPGPGYYVAIAQRVQLNWLRSRLEWVIRPLSAERMRGALMGDKQALILAFGREVSNGQSHV